MATVQSQAIQNANTIISLAQQLLTISQQITTVSAAWSDDNTANTLNAMGTVALNADGSLGTPDGTPNTAHPLNLTTYPTLNRAISANSLAAMLTILNNIPLYVAGTAVGATSGVRGILNSATGG